MRTASLRIFAFGFALVLAACGGQVRWVKAGSDDGAAGSDLANCRAAASSSTQRMYGVPQISSHAGPGVFGGNTASDPSLADRQMREQEAVGRCMRDKGYTLAPAER